LRVLGCKPQIGYSSARLYVYEAGMDSHKTPGIERAMRRTTTTTQAKFGTWSEYSNVIYRGHDLMGALGQNPFEANQMHKVQR
jgi:hypothetical protein